ncbi:12071_t:CDS:2 [Gigaspora margarita]|uniref:12071_t:CDS:1 n=1 Tax=Gigaspora margarita TaxID=4874 RepID=A0ABN7W2I6_GIGMA|nr:12071_t:CDS:2 [Gigaspora margarita]
MSRPEHNINEKIARTRGHNIFDRVIDTENSYNCISIILEDKTPIQWACRIRITLQELLGPGGPHSTYHQYCLHASHAQDTNFDKYNYSRGSKASQFDLMKDHYDHECSNSQTDFGP